MYTPKITCIVPCFKQAHFLPFALSSVESQTFQDWECLIVNDGSPDETHAIANEWVRRDSRFRYIEKTNGGLSSARNAGINVARGELVHFLDADDFIAPNFFELAAKVLTEQPDVALTYGGWFMVDSSGAHLSRGEVPNYGHDSFHFMLERCLCPCHAIITRLSLIKKTGKFDESLKAAEDWNMWLGIAAINPKFVRIDSDVAYYRQHIQSMSRDYKRMLKGGLSVIRKHANSHGDCCKCREALARGELNLLEYVWNISQRSRMEDYWGNGYFFKYFFRSIYFLSVDQRWAFSGLSRLAHSKKLIVKSYLRRLRVFCFARPNTNQ